MVITTTTTTTTNAAGQPTSSLNHHSYQQQQQHQQQQSTVIVGSDITANNSNYQRSTSQQQQKQQQPNKQLFQHPSSSTLSSSSSTSLTTATTATAYNRYYNSLTLNGGDDDVDIGASGNNNNNNNNKGINNCNNNTNTNSNNNIKSRITTTKTALQSGGIIDNVTVQQEGIIVVDHNSLRYTKRPSSLYNGITSFSGQNEQICSSHTAAAEQTADVEREQTQQQQQQSQSHETAKVTKSPILSTTTTATLNLSDALLSTSPPLLNDQISLLFPKCRPRQLSPNNSNATNSHNQCLSSCDSHIVHVKRADINEEYEKSTNHRDLCNEESTRDTTTTPTKPTTANHTNYYRSVNIITQSPPPPSTSSISSESLSSVTPRISTNPFLNSHTDRVENKLHARVIRQEHKNSVEEDKSTKNAQRTRNDKSVISHYNEHDHIIDDDDDYESNNINCYNGQYEILENEDLPVPSYLPTFYYHTETKHTQPQTRQRIPQEIDEHSNSFEMPRRRASYGSHHHHHAQQPYTHFKTSPPAQQPQPSTPQQHQLAQQLQHQEQTTNGTNSASNLNPNPFLKDVNYWDTLGQASNDEKSINVHTTDGMARTRLQTDYISKDVAELNNLTTANLTTQSSTIACTASLTAGVNSTSISSASRRLYQQLSPYSNMRNGVPPRQHYQQQQQQQQHLESHINRHGRNAIENDAESEHLMENLSKRSYQQKLQHQQQQQQQQQINMQTVQNSCAEGLTPLASHYLYGSKTSLEQQHNQQQLHIINISDNSILVERELRERDREQREQRKAMVAYGEWEREREWKMEREREKDRDREREKVNELERDIDLEREREFERQQVRRRDSYLDGSLQYQSIKKRISMRNSKTEETNGHSTMSKGEAVAFDDITESWQNLRVTTDTSAPTMPPPASTTRQHFQQQQQKHQQQQQYHNQHATSLTLADDGKDEYIKQVDVNNHVEDEDVKVTGSHNTINNGTSIMYKDHPRRYLDRSGYTMHAIETRHGIIEYEGSPRRIGGQTVGILPNNTENEVDKIHQQPVVEEQTDGEREINSVVRDVREEVNVEAQLNSQYVQESDSPQHLTKTTMVESGKGGCGDGSPVGGINSQQATTTTTSSGTHNSPQQQYPARPGFPQRIISPPRDCNTQPPQPQPQQQHQQQQQPSLPQRQSSPPTTGTLDNNAEDTSNDVSEIGTISDLTTPEVISAATPIYTTDSPATINANNNTTTKMPISTNGIAACKPLTSTLNSNGFSIPTKSSTFDYLYEFSETRKVLEEFFKCPSIDDRPIENGSDVDSIDIQYEFHNTFDRTDDDGLDSPCNVNADQEIDNDEEDEEGDVDDDDDDDDVDDGLMGVHMDGIQSQQHHHQLQQQHNNHMRKLQTTLQQRNNQREIQIHRQISPTPTTTTTQYRQQQKPTELYQQPLEQQSLQRIQSQEQQQDGGDEQQKQQQQQQQRNGNPRMRSQRQLPQQQQPTPQQQQQNNSSNNSICNSNIYNNSSHAHRRRFTASPLMRDFDFFLDSASRSSGEQLDQQDGVNHNQMEAPSTYRYSPETMDYDSNCGDLDSLSGEINGVSTSCSNYTKYYASSMPVLEDGLSSGHTSDTENNNQNNLNSNLQQPSVTLQHNALGSGGISMLMDMKRLSTNNSINSMNNLTISTTDGGGGGVGGGCGTNGSGEPRNNSLSSNIIHEINYMRRNDSPTGTVCINEDSGRESVRSSSKRDGIRELLGQSPTNNINNKVFKNIDPELDSLYSISIFHRPDMVQMTPPPPAPAPHRKPNIICPETEILQPTPYKDQMHATTVTGLTTPNNVLNTSIGNTAIGSGVTSVASAISTTLNRSKLHTHQQNNSNIIAPSGLNNALRASQSQPQPPIAPSTIAITTASASTMPQPHSQNQTQLQSQAQPTPPPPPPPIPERNMTITRTPSPVMNSPVWLSRHLEQSNAKNLLTSSPGHHSKSLSADEDDVDTDLETDRLLGHQRLDDQGYYDENKSWESRKTRSSLLSKISPKQQMTSTKTRNGYNALLTATPEIPPPPLPPKNSTNKLLDIGGSMSSPEHSNKSPHKTIDVQDCVVTMGSPGGSDGSACISGNSKKDIDLSAINTNGLPHSGGGSGVDVGGGGGVSSSNGNPGVVGGASTLVGSGNANVTVGGGTTSGNGNGVVGGHTNSAGSNSTSGEKKVKKSKNKEGGAVLIEGVLFRAKYLGSTQLVCEGQPTKSTRMMQAEEAVSRIKALAPDGDVQPSTEVDLFISTEKIMVLNTDLKEIMMDHALRTISYIADIGDLVVLMARRRFVPQDIDDAPKPNRTPKMICHVFESDEAQFIAQSIGQAFQVAYMEFLKANGIEDHSFVKEMDYQEVLNSQEIFGDELEIFAKKELQKEVVVPKAKGEILGVVIVESGWGSMLPTVVIANLMSSGAAARCGQLNIGDQLIAINGLSLVGLPLSTCQTYIKNTKNQTVVKFTVVPCAPVVEVKIKRPNTKYQLGFSVQNGVICSLLRGGIAERGGVRVGHRIIEINNQSVVAVPHEKIVNLLATSVGEILMKTMPTSMFRLLTGQENPIYI